MLAEKKTLAELCEGITIYPQVLKNARVKDKEEAQSNPAVLEAVKKVEKELGDDGRILLRASGTEPVVRVMVEASSDELCGKYVDEVISVMGDAGLLL